VRLTDLPLPLPTVSLLAATATGRDVGHDFPRARPRSPACWHRCFIARKTETHAPEVENKAEIVTKATATGIDGFKRNLVSFKRNPGSFKRIPVSFKRNPGSYVKLLKLRRAAYTTVSTKTLIKDTPSRPCVRRTLTRRPSGAHREVPAAAAGFASQSPR